MKQVWILSMRPLPHLLLSVSSTTRSVTHQASPTHAVTLSLVACCSYMQWLTTDPFPHKKPNPCFGAFVDWRSEQCPYFEMLGFIKTRILEEHFILLRRIRIVCCAAFPWLRWVQFFHYIPYQLHTLCTTHQFCSLPLHVAFTALLSCACSLP